MEQNNSLSERSLARSKWMRSSAAVALVLLCGSPSRSFALSDSLTVGQTRSYSALTVFIIDRADEVHRPYLTLERALATHRAVIHENNSQTLWIENLSDT